MPGRSFSYKVSRKAGQYVYRNKTSKPFISGDLFSKEADFSVPGNFVNSKNQISYLKSAKVIFCPGGEAEIFLQEFGKSLAGKVLIVGNSDKDWFDFPLNLAPNVKGVLLQNSFVSGGRITTLPIGIENLSYFGNGRRQNFTRVHSDQVKQDKVLIGPFSPTHQIRNAIRSEVDSSRRVEIASSQLIKPVEYAEYSARFGYVAAPRGNGEDTHRLWESLYRGSSPVILRNAWSISLESLGLPISLVEAWSNESLEELKAFKAFKPSLLSPLWWPFWRKTITDLL
jgi:hypothetical protein